MDSNLRPRSISFMRSKFAASLGSESVTFDEDASKSSRINRVCLHASGQGSYLDLKKIVWDKHQDQ